MPRRSAELAVVDDFKDPYYYIMVALGWVGVVGVLFGVWALTPWFPWK